ncbi:MAG TPA: DUF397 domain-containing protein [Actinocatenispora sp.]
MSTSTQWRTSSRSGSADQNCVEVRAANDGTIRVRDSKDRRGPVLAVGEASWGAFLHGVRAGRLRTR